jgi:hypothetical protein
MFGAKFHPMVEFMKLEDYLDFLHSIDIAVFNHRRQQAMGNIFTLLVRGKKVYLRHDITSWAMLEKLGVKVYRLDEFDLEPIPANQAEQNRRIVSQHFSEETALRQLRKLFAA